MRETVLLEIRDTIANAQSMGDALEDVITDLFDLFTYGSLELPEVLFAVAGEQPRPLFAQLRGYRRRLLRGFVYPAIVPDLDEMTEGVLWQGLSGAALARIDAFEGREYERMQVDVVRLDVGRRDARGAVAADGEREQRAWAYVLRAEHASMLTNEPWDRETFRREHLEEFLKVHEVSSY